MNSKKSLKIFVPRGMKAEIEETDKMEEVKMQIIENGKTVQTISMPVSPTPHNKTDTPANEHGIGNDQRDKRKFLQLRVKDGIRINVDEIMWIKSERNCCMIYMKGNKKELATKPLRHILKLLDNNTIVRVHKSYAINVKHVNSHTSNKICISGNYIPIGREYKALFFDRFKDISHDNDD